MNYKFTLQNLETGEETKFKNLQDVADVLQIKYHTARGIMLKDEKQFLKNEVRTLSKKYSITKISIE